MKEGRLRALELYNLECNNVPAFQRKKKIEERRRVRRSLEGPMLQYPAIEKDKIKHIKSVINGKTGGISSSLNPINPHRLASGEPTVPFEETDIHTLYSN